MGLESASKAGTASRMTEKQRRAEWIFGDLFLGLFCFRCDPNGLEKDPGSVIDPRLGFGGSVLLE